MQQYYLIDGPEFTGTYFEERDEKWNNRKDEIEKKKKEELTDEDIKFRKRYKWNGPHIAFGIDGVEIYVIPGILHGSGHTVTLVFDYISQVIDTSCFEYRMMIRNLECFDGYLVCGEICAGTELMHKMIHQLRNIFCCSRVLFDFV